jgi:hypothetical protein
MPLLSKFEKKWGEFAQIFTDQCNVRANYAETVASQQIEIFSRFTHDVAQRTIASPAHAPEHSYVRKL